MSEQTENIVDVRITQVVTYGRHTVKANGSVDLVLDASYNELTKTIQVLQLLNNDVFIKARVPQYGVMKLGMFRIHRVAIDNDGESRITLNSTNDYVELDNINILPRIANMQVKEFTILMESEVELEDEE